MALTPMPVAAVFAPVARVPQKTPKSNYFEVF